MSGNNVSQVADPAKRLMRVAEARTAMLSVVQKLGREHVALDEVLGRVLAEPVSASRDQPPFAVSAMDGYAVRHADAPGMLRVIGESAAGRGFAGRCEAGTAVRISTGAAIPQGADAVVIQEDVRREGDRVKVPATIANGNIRAQGLDFARGQILLQPGRSLDGIGLSLAAATGIAKLDVTTRPRVAILSSGDELAPPGSTLGPWQIFDSATYGMAGLIKGWGAVPRRLAVEKDDVEAIARAAEEGLSNSDILVLVGGASVGDHDLARPALMKLGLEILVGKIAIRPGKPTWFGRARAGLVLGLPGNPASALVCARLFLKPILDKMLGRDPAASIGIHRARLAEALPANGPREHYLRARAEVDDQARLTVKAFEDQDSSRIAIFAAANALIRLPADAPALERDALVDVLMLDAH
ncbi:MAG TPA: gephyrin-like molybdotransferase Glp [Rhizomicrobium sp.]|nr:gephyrin-like molybdotransferase Glp [Rhizomicrobium sp.]